MPQPAGWSFQKFTKRAIDWAIVGCRGAGQPGGPGEHGGSGRSGPAAVEQALAAGAGLQEAAAHAAEGTSPPEDMNGDRAYREHLARVLVGRALAEASAR